MKLYMLGTVGGLGNDSFAVCDMGCPNGEFYVGQNQLSWWRWGCVCPQCGMNATTRLVPWKMTWQEGSDRIGDLAGYDVPCWSVIAQKKVIDFFHTNDFFVNVYKTIFQEVPPQSPRSRKSRYPIVDTTPYEGPSFWGISPQYGVHFNIEKSRNKCLSSCSVCGNIQYRKYPWNNLVIDEEEWNGLKLFGVFGCGQLLTPGNGVFLSEEGHDELLKQGFSNLKCVEVGRTEKAGHGKMKPYREQADYDFWKPDEYILPPSKTKLKKQKKTQIG